MACRTSRSSRRKPNKKESQSDTGSYSSEICFEDELSNCEESVNGAQMADDAAGGSAGHLAVNSAGCSGSICSDSVSASVSASDCKKKRRLRSKESVKRRSKRRRALKRKKKTEESRRDEDSTSLNDEFSSSSSTCKSKKQRPQRTYTNKDDEYFDEYEDPLSRKFVQWRTLRRKLLFLESNPI